MIVRCLIVVMLAPTGWLTWQPEKRAQPPATVLNSATIDFSPLNDVDKKGKPFELTFEIVDDQGCPFLILKMTFTTGSTDATTPTGLAVLALDELGWKTTETNGTNLTIHSREVRGPNGVSRRALLAVRLVAHVARPEWKPKVTTTGTVFDMSP